jgi:hypothetical protein
MNSVRVSTGFTSNLGNFESLRTQVEYERELAPGESFEDAIDEVFAQVEQKLVEKARDVYETMTADAGKETQIRPRS